MSSQHPLICLFQSFGTPALFLSIICVFLLCKSCGSLLFKNTYSPLILKRMPRVRLELTTFRLWDWRAAYCANEATERLAIIEKITERLTMRSLNSIKTMYLQTQILRRRLKSTVDALSWPHAKAMTKDGKQRLWRKCKTKNMTTTQEMMIQWRR